jgi:hypothetical protein
VLQVDVTPLRVEDGFEDGFPILLGETVNPHVKP